MDLRPPVAAIVARLVPELPDEQHIGWVSVGGQPDGPSGASGGVVPDEVGAGTAWSGCCGQGADAGEDLVEQFMARW